ncbi:hypothetical protein [Pseudomonas coronafaciens]|uniref:Uncharacterized protein n=1 Tax=Pseudomonas coronafaciens pv. coronafaciens TaxID=235275 RepID=A0AAE6UL73_9PSED|nr:hypothetical protein [Pseudomonas coronafaciens]QGT81372.1 hypothetical protein GMO17_09330 [Pseudomonas coronafaciens pv. coronafaciens]RMS13180.1 hypothetical protein ALP72_00936 [Pseudomonas coronafaciens pv. coronafaciens]
MVTALNTLNVLIVVDVEGATTSGDLGSNVYLIDSSKYFGSGQEGQDELVTACVDGQIIIWSITPVNPGDDAQISGFTGQMVDSGVCSPKQVTIQPGETAWSGRVESQGKTGNFQYTCNLSFEGKVMSFDPFLNVKTS